jgi:hypothetical protein
MNNMNNTKNEELILPFNENDNENNINMINININRIINSSLQRIQSYTINEIGYILTSNYKFQLKNYIKNCGEIILSTNIQYNLFIYLENNNLSKYNYLLPTLTSSIINILKNNKFSFDTEQFIFDLGNYALNQISQSDDLGLSHYTLTSKNISFGGKNAFYMENRYNIDYNYKGIDFGAHYGKYKFIYQNNKVQILEMGEDIGAHANFKKNIDLSFNIRNGKQIINYKPQTIGNTIVSKNELNTYQGKMDFTLSIFGTSLSIQLPVFNKNKHQEIYQSNANNTPFYTRPRLKPKSIIGQQDITNQIETIYSKSNEPKNEFYEISSKLIANIVPKNELDTHEKIITKKNIIDSESKYFGYKKNSSNKTYECGIYNEPEYTFKIDEEKNKIIIKCTSHNNIYSFEDLIKEVISSKSSWFSSTKKSTFNYKPGENRKENKLVDSDESFNAYLSKNDTPLTIYINNGVKENVYALYQNEIYSINIQNNEASLIYKSGYFGTTNNENTELFVQYNESTMLQGKLDSKYVKDMDIKNHIKIKNVNLFQSLTYSAKDKPIKVETIDGKEMKLIEQTYIYNEEISNNTKNHNTKNHEKLGLINASNTKIDVKDQEDRIAQSIIHHKLEKASSFLIFHEKNKEYKKDINLILESIKNKFISKKNDEINAKYFYFDENNNFEELKNNKNTKIENNYVGISYKSNEKSINKIRESRIDIHTVIITNTNNEVLTKDNYKTFEDTVIQHGFFITNTSVTTKLINNDSNNLNDEKILNNLIKKVNQNDPSMDTKIIPTISPHFSAGISTLSREYGALLFRMLSDSSTYNNTRKIDYFLPLAKGSFQFMGSMMDTALSNYHGINNYGIIGSMAYSGSYFLNCSNTWFAQYNYGTIQEVINENEFVIKFFNYKESKKVKLSEEMIYKFKMIDDYPSLIKDNNYNFDDVFAQIDKEFINIINKTKENIENINVNHIHQDDIEEIIYQILITINSILQDNYSCYNQYTTYKEKQNYLNNFNDSKNKIINLFSEIDLDSDLDLDINNTNIYVENKLFLNILDTNYEHEQQKEQTNNYMNHIIQKYKSTYLEFTENVEKLISHLIKEYDLVGLIINYKDVLPQFGNGITYAMLTTGLCYCITDNLKISAISSVLQIAINSIFDISDVHTTWSEFFKSSSLSIVTMPASRFLSGLIADYFIGSSTTLATQTIYFQMTTIATTSLIYIGTYIIVAFMINFGYECFMDYMFIEYLKNESVKNYNEAVKNFSKLNNLNNSTINNSINNTINNNIDDYLVNNDDDKNEIRKKYMKLALKVHPDKINYLSEENKKKANDNFAILNNCFEELNEKIFKLENKKDEENTNLDNEEKIKNKNERNNDYYILKKLVSYLSKMLVNEKNNQNHNHNQNQKTESFIPGTFYDQLCLYELYLLGKTNKIRIKNKDFEYIGPAIYKINEKIKIIYEGENGKLINYDSNKLIIYEGSFKNNKFDGKGKLIVKQINSDIIELSQEGLWKNNEFINGTLKTYNEQKNTENQVILTNSEEFTIINKNISYEDTGKIIQKSILNNEINIYEGLFNKNKNLIEGTIINEISANNEIVKHIKKGFFENFELNCESGIIIIELMNKENIENKLMIEIIGKFIKGKSINNVQMYAYNISSLTTTKTTKTTKTTTKIFDYNGTINNDNIYAILNKGKLTKYINNELMINQHSNSYKKYKSENFNININECINNINYAGKLLEYYFENRITKTHYIYDKTCSKMTIKQINDITIIKEGTFNNELELDGLKCVESTYYNDNLINEQKGKFVKDKIVSGCIKNIDDYKTIIYESDSEFIYNNTRLMYHNNSELNIIFKDKNNNPCMRFQYIGMFDANIPYPHFKSGQFITYDLHTNEKIIENGDFHINNNLIPLLNSKNDKSLGKRIKFDGNGIHYENIEGIFKNGLFQEGLYEFITYKSNKEYFCKYIGEVKLINNMYCFTTSEGKVSMYEIYDSESKKLLQRNVGIFNGTIDDPYKFILGEIN